MPSGTSDGRATDRPFDVEMSQTVVYRVRVSAADPDDARQRARDMFDAAGYVQRAAWTVHRDKPRDYTVFDEQGNELPD